jgi:hypothetical protein
MTGGIFVRLAVIATIVAVAVWLNTPDGRIQADALRSRATETANQMISKIRARPAEAVPAATPSTTTAVVAPAVPPQPITQPQAAVPGPQAPEPDLVPMPPSAPAVNAPVTATTNPLPSGAAPSAPTVPAAGPQLSSDQIFKLQRKLIDLGYLEGNPDVHASTRMTAAFNQWRKETGRTYVQSVGPDEYAAFLRAINR